MCLPVGAVEMAGQSAPALIAEGVELRGKLRTATHNHENRCTDTCKFDVSGRRDSAAVRPWN